jgi:hypothetical protein
MLLGVPEHMLPPFAEPPSVDHQLTGIVAQLRMKLPYGSLDERCRKGTASPEDVVYGVREQAGFRAAPYLRREHHCLYGLPYPADLRRLGTLTLRTR